MFYLLKLVVYVFIMELMLVCMISDNDLFSAQG